MNPRKAYLAATAAALLPWTGANAQTPSAARPAKPKLSAPTVMKAISRMLNTRWHGIGMPYEMDSVSFSIHMPKKNSAPRTSTLTINLMKKGTSAGEPTIIHCVTSHPCTVSKLTGDPADSWGMDTILTDYFKGKIFAAPSPVKASLTPRTPYTGIANLNGALRSLLMPKPYFRGMEHFTYTNINNPLVTANILMGPDKGNSTRIQLFFDKKSGKLDSAGFTLRSQTEIEHFSIYHKMLSDTFAWCIKNGIGLAPDKNFAPKAIKKPTISGSMPVSAESSFKP